MDRAVLLWLLSLLACTVAFFGPFVVLRMRRAELKSVTRVALVGAAAFVMLYATEKAVDLDGDSVSLLFALGFLPLGIAAGARQGWRFVAPAGGVLGLTVLALMAWGPLHPIYRGPRMPLPPAITPIVWALLLVGTLLLFVPRRLASLPAAALLWLLLVVAALHDSETRELLRVYYMGGPAFFALAALLSAGVPMRKPGDPRPEGIESHG